ncbi:GNAT family N-acetyltransferase [Neobacillus sp. SuZ13]|uniref:GNAT family N-acetyltransferase n=1 Tax=Neobacillus sp. SuZ13 TaxID=3047875 RepID=UPI0024BF1215|nr:GNAT family N-acetyltransferase [Neobacillus sp. SuZ13]WHY64443.1 GNAT family N-acetyltransferase [Neobacillus sp. SuZ13]
MIELLHFQQGDCPSYIKKQIISLMRQEWPQAFGDNDEEIHWPDSIETQPTSLVFVENNIVINHVAIPWKYISHKGQKYKAFGLSEVITNSSFRKQGFGLRLIKEAYSLIEKNNPDISLFTCEPALVHLYTKGGWEHKQNINLIGGTRNQPFRSDSLGLCTMIKLFSAKAQIKLLTFEETDVYLELGERKLW